MEKEMLDALIIPTYEFIHKEAPLAKSGSRLRIEGGRKLIREGTVSRQCIVPFPQKGLPQKGPDLSLGQVTLGKNVADYVRALPEFSEAKILEWPASEATFGDTMASVDRILDEAKGQAVHLHFVSDPAQLRRLRFIWHYVLKRRKDLTGWKASFHSVKNFRSIGELIFREFCLSYPKCVIDCLRERKKHA